MVDSTCHRQKNLNHFSDKLTLELKKILESKFNTKLNDEEVQEAGINILFFILTSKRYKQAQSAQAN